MSDALLALLASSEENKRIAEGVQELVSGRHRVIVHAAGSTGGLNDWLGAPGSSRFFDGYIRTHGRRMTEELVGRELTPPFVSEDVAIHMAASAYERALKYAVLDGEAGRPIIAVAITSAVSTNRARRGEDRAIICIRIQDGYFLVDVQMDKVADGQAARDMRRDEQARFIDLVALNAIFHVSGVAPMVLGAGGFQSEQFEPAGDGKVTVMPKRIDEDPDVFFDLVFDLPSADGGLAEPLRIDQIDWSDYVLFPGSFNPLHYGHLEMAKWMEYRTGRKVIFQISQHHPVKTHLAFDEELLRARLSQFRYRHPVVVTPHHGLYIDKGKLFAGAHILMGADALVHMLNFDFYERGESELREGLTLCQENGTIFWVVDRRWEGNVLTLKDIEVPFAHRRMFQQLSAVNEISSSQIRGQQGR
jgi:hypothetical protein